MVDDGSDRPEGIDALTAAYRHAASPRWFVKGPCGDWISYYRIEHAGCFAALNEGIRHMTTPWFAWLSSDDLFYDRKVETQLRAMESAKRNSGLTYPSDGLISFHGYDQMIADWGLATQVAIPVLWRDMDEQRKILSSGCYINGLTAMIHKSVLEEVKLLIGDYFDTSITIASDWELWLRIGMKHFWLPISEILATRREYDNATERYAMDPEKRATWMAEDAAIRAEFTPVTGWRDRGKSANLITWLAAGTRPRSTARMGSSKRSLRAGGGASRDLHRVRRLGRREALEHPPADHRGGMERDLNQSDLDRFGELCKTYKNHLKTTRCIRRTVGFDPPDTLDEILDGLNQFPRDYDLLSIDVDGCDYWILATLRRRPKIVVVEFNPTIPNAVEFTQARDMAVHHGSSLRAIDALARSGGYAARRRHGDECHLRPLGTHAEAGGDQSLARSAPPRYLDASPRLPALRRDRDACGRERTHLAPRPRQDHDPAAVESPVVPWRER